MALALSNLIDPIVNICSLIKQPCLLCSRYGAHDGLCPGCRADLPILPKPCCPVCSEPQPVDPGEVPCARCRHNPPAFDRLHVPYLYGYPLAELIHDYKYGKKLEMAGVLSRLLSDFAANAGGEADFVAPVPLARTRLAERGFNQCDALAAALAATLSARFTPTLCWRKRNTDAQAGLALDQRRRNMRDAFGVKHRLDGLCVAIVDDVASSGSTLSSLAVSLKKMGAKRVEAWVLSRAFFTKT